MTKSFSGFRGRTDRGAERLHGMRMNNERAAERQSENSEWLTPKVAQCHLFKLSSLFICQIDWHFGEEYAKIALCIRIPQRISEDQRKVGLARVWGMLSSK